MHTIVKIFVALVFSHLTLTATDDIQKKEKGKEEISIKAKIYDCALKQHDYKLNIS